MITWAPKRAQVRAIGSSSAATISRAWAGPAASSSASMTMVNRDRPRSCDNRRCRAGTRSSTVRGIRTDAARAISVATSSAVLPLACTAQAMEPIGARTFWSSGGSAATTPLSAVVTIRPSTADLPTPGDPVTTSTCASGRGRLTHFTISVSAAVRPRKR